MGVKLGLSHRAKNTDWECWRRIDWRKITGPIRKKGQEDGNNYNMRNFAIGTPHRATKSRTTELGRGTQQAWEGTEMHIRF